MKMVSLRKNNYVLAKCLVTTMIYASGYLVQLQEREDA